MSWDMDMIYTWYVVTIYHRNIALSLSRQITAQDLLLGNVMWCDVIMLLPMHTGTKKPLRIGIKID